MREKSVMYINMTSYLVSFQDLAQLPPEVGLLVLSHLNATDPGADPGIYFGGGQTKVPNRTLRAKPESRARSARVSRAKPESRARSARELRAKPKPRAKPEKNRGRGLGRGLGEPLPRKFFEKSNLKPFILVHI